MAKDQKVYMPLVIGDWLKGTRGMRAEVRGVYINLLLFQWDNGYIPSDMDELFLIDPEVGKVWDKLKGKFVPAGPGKLQNKKNEEVREFWRKQSKNGEKGGRPKKENPEQNPNDNPNQNPNNNHHIDIDHDNGIKIKKESISKNEIFEQLFTDQRFVTDLQITHKGKDINQAWNECYTHHSSGPSPPNELWEWKQKLNSWLTIKKPDNANSKTKREQNSNALKEAIANDIMREFGSG